MTRATPSPASDRSPVARTALAWLAVFAGSLLAAAALTPLVHAAVVALDLDRSWTFSRVYNRVAMAAALAALVAFRRWTGWRAARTLLGRTPAARAGAEALAGFAVALAAVGVGVAWAFAAARLGPAAASFAPTAGRMAKLFAGAAIAATIEELFFRALMLGSLAARAGWRWAVLASSALYAAVHLLAPDRRFAPEGVDPGSGFRYLRGLLTGQLEPAAIPPLVGLFLAGLVLALVVRQTGSLGIAIGLHAGWALSFQVLRQATHVLDPIPGTSRLATVHFLVGTPWAWASILLAGGLVLAATAFAEWRRATPGRLATE